MIFGTVDICNSAGCYLAHSVQTATGRISKGTRITPELARRLEAEGFSSILVAQLDDDDVHEDTAALTFARALASDGINLTTARTGRVNLLAGIEGLFHFDSQAVIAANAVDEGITVATLPENQWVAQGRMIATVKIIPYAVERDNLERVLAITSRELMSVKPAIPRKAFLIQTRLPSIKESVLDKTSRITQNRLVPRQVELISETRCMHAVNDLLAEIEKHMQHKPDKPDWLIIVGASAISDRADIIPEAIIAAGGTIDRYGIPADPGNLLLLAHIGNTTVIGLPGCARSPRYNGLDKIIDRLACGIPISNDWLSRLSVGGLFTEIASRPEPRMEATAQRKVGIVILAAGSSRRAGKLNKLLVPYDDSTLVGHVAIAALESRADHIVAVTGFENKLVEQQLANIGINCHYNGAHASGMASSVIAGVSQLIDCDAVLVCLGDMPHITAAILNQLMDAFKDNPDKSIFLPVINKQRGNPVLFSKVFFDTLLKLEGDSGAKKLVQQYPDKVFEVSVDTDAVLVDYDTEQELNKLGQAW